ncbi:MAG: MFS transporter [Gammaproteobacteria bacterium]
MSTTGIGGSAAPPAAPVSEFRNGWRMLVAASIGIAFGASPIPYNSIGAFTVPLTEEFGWGRGDVQFAILGFTIAVVIAVPIIGALADRFGVRRVALATLIAFGLGFAALSLTPASLFGFYAIWIVTGLLGGGSTPVTWTRGVNAWFEKRRGMALAIALMGTGITAAILPRLTTWLIAGFGWRTAFAAISLLPLAVALPIAIAWFREPTFHPSEKMLAPPEQTGVTVRQALANYRFWVIAVALFVIATGVGGLITNFLPLLTDRGFTVADAAWTSGAIGVSLIIGRLGVGYLLDRVWAPLVTFPLLVMPAIACVILMQDQVGQLSAIAAACMIGVAAGAETDLVAYLAARYFGLRNYGTIYGLQYAVFAMASGLAPWAFGRVYDQFGTYDPILIVSSIGFVVGAAALLTLGRYPDFSAKRNQATDSPLGK